MSLVWIGRIYAIINEPQYLGKNKGMVYRPVIVIGKDKLKLMQNQRHKNEQVISIQKLLKQCLNFPSVRQLL